MLRVQDATKRYGPRTLWSGITFEAGPGQMLAVTGPSGCGKSTLLHCLGMLEPLTSGSISLDGEAIHEARGRRRRRLWRDQIGFLFQDYALIENASVGTNVQVVRPHIRPSTALKKTGADALAAVGLAGREGEPTFRLSGGEQQRVAVARIIAKQPTLLLADEPTGSLDPANETMVLRHLRSLADDGHIVVVATHSPTVRGACDIVLDLAMTDGELQRPDSPMARRDR